MCKRHLFRSSCPCKLFVPLRHSHCMQQIDPAVPVHIQSDSLGNECRETQFLNNSQWPIHCCIDKNLGTCCQSNCDVTFPSKVLKLKAISRSYSRSFFPGRSKDTRSTFRFGFGHEALPVWIERSWARSVSPVAHPDMHTSSQREGENHYPCIT